MVNINLKCICCGREWVQKVDEHSLPQYSKKGQGVYCCPEQRPQLCIDDVKMDSVCYECWDHMHKVKDF